MNSKLLGGTLLLTGTAMGGGLLALPLITAEMGFLNAFCLMVFCWSLMTANALLTVEASLWFSSESNIISMTAKLLHPWATYIAWVSYLFLFYSITAAYIASGADFLSYIAQNFGMHFFGSVSPILFTTILAALIYQGMHCIDYLNRWFMFIKLSLYIGLVLFIFPHVIPAYWYEGSLCKILQGFSVVVTAFSYANIIPSLRHYFGQDIHNLKKAILIGSTIPLICYTLWNMCITGVIPLHGNLGLIKLSQMDSAPSRLVGSLHQILHYPFFPLLLSSFSCVCIFTTSLTCSFGLSDFLADGLHLTKGKSRKADLVIYGTTFIPPLLIAWLFPSIFITALRYAGIYCLILFGVIPIALVWRGRYQLHYQTAPWLPGGKSMLLGLGATTILGLSYSLYQVIA